MNISTSLKSKNRGLPFFRIGQIFARLQRARRIRRDLRHLEGLSNHMLRDIGIRREDAAFTVRYGRGEIVDEGEVRRGG